MGYKLFVLDNIDSFTYNLVHLCQQVLQQRFRMIPEVWVARHQVFTLDELNDWQPDAIIISPGPGHPSQAGLTLPVIARYAGHKPLFGVCLGMQAMALHYGATITQGQPTHGKLQAMTFDAHHPMWAGMPSDSHEAPTTTVVRYHSLHADYDSLQHTALEVTATLPPDAPGQSPIPMAIASGQAGAPVWGVQYHPESYKTNAGHVLVDNFFQQASAFSSCASTRSSGDNAG